MNQEEPKDRRLPAVSPARWGGRLVIVLLLSALFWLSYMILRDFLVPLLWAAILAYLTWPLNVALRRQFKERRGAVSLIMTLFLFFAIVLPLVTVIVALRQELGEALTAVSESIETGELGAPEWLRQIPGVGARAEQFLSHIMANPEELGQWLTARAEMLLGGAAGVLGVLVRNAAKFGLALLASFFFYRDGERWVADWRRGLSYLLGDQADLYWNTAADMTRAVVYGLVLTAIAQGALAGVGYWVVGLPAPALLGALTAMLALVPFGAPVVWGSLTVWLLLQGDLVAGIGLLLWGVFGISLVDNFVRPLVISASANVSFLMVLIGVLGGLKAFGLVGLFLGPAVLAVLWAVWHQWLEQSGRMPGREERRSE